jgi:hypothetical protein
MKIRYLQAERYETGASCVSSGVINGGLAPKFFFYREVNLEPNYRIQRTHFIPDISKKKRGETKEGNTHTPKAAYTTQKRGNKATMPVTRRGVEHTK